ncbi:MAG: hypothetical protein R3F37_02445 [Candidatus Competibacteraceae bacterium]
MKRWHTVLRCYGRSWRKVSNESGLTAGKAEGLAALLVSAYEGGLLQARVAGSLAPMQQMGESLFDLITQQLQREQS